jgi:hypothetical protein
MRVESDKGVTYATPEYYAEADPELMTIRARYLTGELTKSVARLEVLKRVGQWRVNADIKPFQSLISSQCIDGFVRWQVEHPLIPRLYGDSGVITTVMLAPEGAETVKVEED